jgi:hypothetical protein
LPNKTKNPGVYRYRSALGYLQSTWIGCGFGYGVDPGDVFGLTSRGMIQAEKWF